MPQEIDPGAVRMGVGGVQGGGGGGGGGGRRRRRGRGGGGGGGGRPTGGNPLNALLSRAGEIMDFQMGAAEREIPRQEQAFDLYTRGQESELEDAETRRQMARQEQTWARQRELAGGKKSREDAIAVQQRERAARNDAARGRGPASLTF